MSSASSKNSVAGGAAVKLAGVDVEYATRGGAVHALRNLSLEIPSGQFVCILGPSGCGKTTVFQLLTALLRPTRGQVWVGETEVSALSSHEAALFRRGGVAAVFQFFNLSPALTLEENVALPLLAGKTRLNEVREEIAKLLSSLGIEGYQSRSLADLSGGEMQRAAIARALLVKAPLLVADEPTGNLDTASGRQVLELLREACDERGMTMVVLTHDLRTATYADRVIELRDGQIETDVQADPSSLE